jgi:excisionase family DNA binding protein
MSGEFEPLIDSKRAGRLLGVHPKTVQKMARAGRLPGIRIGKHWRFRESDLDSWIRCGLHSQPALCVPLAKEEA